MLKIINTPWYRFFGWNLIWYAQHLISHIAILHFALFCALQRTISNHSSTTVVSCTATEGFTSAFTSSEIKSWTWGLISTGQLSVSVLGGSSISSACVRNAIFASLLLLFYASSHADYAMSPLPSPLPRWRIVSSLRLLPGPRYFLAYIMLPHRQREGWCGCVIINTPYICRCHFTWFGLVCF